MSNLPGAIFFALPVLNLAYAFHFKLNFMLVSGIFCNAEIRPIKSQYFDIQNLISSIQSIGHKNNP